MKIRPLKDGVSGWIVPAGDVQALEERIEWCVDNIDKVRSMSTHARLAAEQAGWSAYRKRIYEILGEFSRMTFSPPGNSSA